MELDTARGIYLTNSLTDRLIVYNYVVWYLRLCLWYSENEMALLYNCTLWDTI